MRITSSPWGPVQSQKQIADGIVSVETAGHGGYWISQKLRDAMPADCRAVQSPYSPAGWYEEDCDWAIVCLAFPHLFRPQDFYFAVCTCNGTDYLKHLATVERKSIAAAWLAANGDKWAKGGEGTHLDENNRHAGWFVNIYKLTDPSQRKSKVFAKIPILPAVFTLEQFESAPLFEPSATEFAFMGGGLAA